MSSTSPQAPPNPRLPPETIVDILTHALTEPPVCALALLCPQWNLCCRPHQSRDALLRSIRVDTYTLPLSPEPGIGPGTVPVPGFESASDNNARTTNLPPNRARALDQKWEYLNKL